MLALIELFIIVVISALNVEALDMSPVIDIWVYYHLALEEINTTEILQVLVYFDSPLTTIDKGSLEQSISSWAWK